MVRGERFFQGKTIFIISHENWGTMLLSKHHYAMELAKMGNAVYFINHPDQRRQLRRGEIRVKGSGVQNLLVIENRLLFPYFFKFRFPRLYQWLVALHIKKIISLTKRTPDIVWSFDSDNTFPLRCFPEKAIKILMPVDGPFGHKNEIEAADKADVIISVTDDILKVYENKPSPKMKVAHGVADIFLTNDQTPVNNDRISVGYSGSLLRADIDHDTLSNLISANPDKTFEFWGEHDVHNSNIHLAQDVTSTTKALIEKLRSSANVKLHGPVAPQELAAGLRRMDVLLICYKHDCQNSHKILEYLGTGKVIVASRVRQYVSECGLLEMISNNNSEYPNLFDRVTSDLANFNSVEKCERRRQYARQYSYANNISRIEKFIEKSNSL